MRTSPATRWPVEAQVDLDTERAGELAQLGDVCRRARQAKRLSLDDASQGTHIRSNFLAAIERGELGVYDSAVVATGHIQIYARFLQVDITPHLAALKPQSSPHLSLTTSKATFRVPRRRSTSVATYAFLSSLVVLFGYLYLQYAAFISTTGTLPAAAPTDLLVATPLPSPQIVAIDPTSLPTLTTGERPASISPSPTPAPPAVPTLTLPPAPTKPSGVFIEAITTDRAWVQIETDSRVVYSGILNAGERRSWAANQRLMLWTGNAGSVSVTYNGKSLGRLGAIGEVVRITWTAA